VCEDNIKININPLNADLNPIYLLALLGAHHILHFSKIRVKYGINNGRLIYFMAKAHTLYCRQVRGPHVEN